MPSRGHPVVMLGVHNTADFHVVAKQSPFVTFKD